MKTFLQCVAPSKEELEQRKDPGCQCCPCCLAGSAESDFVKAAADLIAGCLGDAEKDPEKRIAVLESRVARALKPSAKATPSSLAERADAELRGALNELSGELESTSLEETSKQPQRQPQSCAQSVCEAEGASPPFSALDDAFVEQIEPLVSRMLDDLIQTQTKAEALLETFTADGQRQRKECRCSTDARCCCFATGVDEKCREAAAPDACQCAEKAIRGLTFLRRDCTFKQQALQEVLRAVSLLAEGGETSALRTFSVAKAARLAWVARPFLGTVEGALRRLNSHLLAAKTPAHPK